MHFNPEVIEALKVHKIDRSQGILCLLAIYHNLEAETIIPPEVMQKVNHTHIVEKDYNTNTLNWKLPLFEGMEADAFDWVEDWIKPFGEIGGPSRRGTKKECIVRMKKFFADNPHIRKDNVYAARDLYFTTEKPTRQYVKTSHKFIYDGAGAMKTSPLLMWCEKVLQNKGVTSDPNMKGKIIR